MILDYLKDDKQLQEYIDENEKIIEKYHRKIDEIFQLMKDYNQNGKDIQWPSIAVDYRKMEEEEKRSCLEKRKKLTENEINNQTTTTTHDDQGLFL